MTIKLRAMVVIMATLSIVSSRAQSLESEISSFLGYEVAIERIDTIAPQHRLPHDPNDVYIVDGKNSQLDWHKGEIKPAPLFALKSNMLYDIATAINIEVEIPLGRRWSVAAEWIFPWWLSESRQRSFEMLNGNLEGRYWFGEREQREIMTGWSLGLYAGGGYYDLEWNKKGYQGEYMLSGGLSGAYTHPIGERLRLEYSLGLGTIFTKYRRYEAQRKEVGGWCLKRLYSGRKGWFGPTRARVSLVWMIGDKSKLGER